MKHRRMIVWIAMLLLLSLGCSLFGSKATEEPTAVAQPTTEQQEGKETPEEQKATPEATAVPTAESAGEDEGFSVDTDALEDLDSYRMQMTLSFTAEDGTVEETSIEEEATRDPFAQHYTITSAGQSLEFIRVGDTQWMNAGEDWMQTPVSEDESTGEFGQFLQLDQMFSDVDKDSYQYLGKETINGMNTRHYRLKEDAWNTAWDLTGEEEGTIEEGTMELWVVNENNLPQFAARLEIHAKGTFSEDRKGELLITEEILDINAPITIEPPAEAEGMGLPEGLELCPDSSGLTVMGAMSFFTCPSTVEDTAKFYMEALENAGWEVDGEVSTDGGMVMGNWKKGEEALSLTISADEESGGSSVMITLGE
ncbi:MAG TPA: hypothetical protein PLH19_09705 [Anaerolineae bacterium]|nr:hypothetical protein [Anaerolineae bacterium]HQH38794.1 hypothetical protein [Anaerolineae bacterium]